MTPTLPRPISFGPFGGLDLDIPPGDVGAERAIDLLDVDWDARGVLGSRMGVEELTTESPEECYDAIFGAGVANLTTGESFALLARRGETLVRLNAEFKEEGETLAVSVGRLSFARMGGATLTPITWIANQNNPVARFDGEEFSEPTATVDGTEGEAMPAGHFVAVWQDASNRLVVANTTLEGGPAGAASSPSHVWFSEPGNPEAWESTAYVQLNPGDGEQICDVIEWGRQILVFKETHLFVFYGVDEDEEGRPIFDFRTVDLGTRCLPRRGGISSVAAGPEGVYFLARDGIWVTTGAEPTQVADAPDLSGDLREPRTTLGGFAFPAWNRARGMVYLDGRLHVGLAEVGGEGTGDEHVIRRLLTIDIASGRVTLWKTDLYAPMAWATGYDIPRRLFFSGAGENKGIYVFTPEADTDPTVEMEPFYETGFFDFGDPDEKTLAHTKVWGTGEIELAFGADYGTPAHPKTLQLGTEGAIAQRQAQGGQTATCFNLRVSGDAPWSVQRIIRYVRESRVPETQRP